MNGYDLVKNEIQTMEWQSNRDSNSIAENVIHSLIREIDANLIVGYYPSSGKLLRPKVKRKWFPRSASFLHLVMAHNLLVFKTKTIRVLQSKNVKGFCA
jgi:hypothetical protein